MPAKRAIAVGALVAILAGLLAVGGEPASEPTTRPAANGEAASQPATQPASQPAPKAFTIATYNINVANRNLKEVAATISRSKADLVCLQEVNRASASYFRRHLRKEFAHMDFRIAGAHSGLGFLAKKPFKSVKHLKARHGVHDAWVIQISIDDRPVQVAAVHLQPTVPRRGEGPAAVVLRLLAAEEIRAREIARVHENLLEEIPAIILGDFNSISTMKAPLFLAEKGFIDSFASVTQEPDSHATWLWPGGRLAIAFRVDYIFHTKELETLESRVIESEGSDHYLVASELAWAAKGNGEVATTRPAEGRGEPASDTGR
ncbi:MAG: endonuclease/exonuclease/phosphatase family protein [Planctomycetota bacterium]